MLGLLNLSVKHGILWDLSERFDEGGIDSRQRSGLASARQRERLADFTNAGACRDPKGTDLENRHALAGVWNRRL